MLCHQAALATYTRRRNASAIKCLGELGVSLSVYLLPRARCRVRELIWRDSYHRAVLIVKLADRPADATFHVGMIPGEARDSPELRARVAGQRAQVEVIDGFEHDMKQDLKISVSWFLRCFWKT
jgi:hypothetical protein